MTPALKRMPPIPYVSSQPAISFPILIVWLLVAHFLAKNYLKTARGKASEGLRLGIVFSAVNILLDALVLVLVLKAGAAYFMSLTVWAGYLLLLIIPTITGQRQQKYEPQLW